MRSRTTLQNNRGGWDTRARHAVQIGWRLEVAESSPCSTAVASVHRLWRRLTEAGWRQQQQQQQQQLRLYYGGPDLTSARLPALPFDHQHGWAVFISLDVTPDVGSSVRSPVPEHDANSYSSPSLLSPLHVPSPLVLSPQPPCLSKTPVPYTHAFSHGVLRIWRRPTEYHNCNVVHPNRVARGRRESLATFLTVSTK